MSGAHVIDIDQLVDSITRKVKSGCLRCEGGEHELTRALIHKIDKHIRMKYEDAYAPILLTVGPYNHGIPVADNLKMVKYELLDYILHSNQEKGLPDYLKALSELEERVRSFYSEEICMGRNEFLKMLLLDGCFLLVLLRGIEELNAGPQEPNGCNMGTYMNEEITRDQLQLQAPQDAQQEANPINQLDNQNFWHDLLLLENQIPFFVITKIQETILGVNSMSSKFIGNIIDFVEIALGCHSKAISKFNQPKEFYHLLHLFHIYLRPCSKESEIYENQVKGQSSHDLLQSGRTFIRNKVWSSQGLQATQSGDPYPWRWHRATEYNQAGIGFEKRKYCSENPHSLLDIVFSNNTIEIPCLTIEPITKTLFCNLVAFEQTCPQFGSYVTAYVTFLSSLINMPDDVSVLTKSGIIVHQLNTDAEVCDLFKEIRECAALSYHNDNYLKPLYTRIEAHYMSKRPVLRTLFSLVSTKVRSWTESSESSGSILPVTTSQENPI